jgi:hypothetical protein
LDIAIDDFRILQWDFWVDVAALLFEMLQYIIFNVAAHNFQCCSTYFSMLEYMFFRCCTKFFCVVAVHDFRCCSTYFSMLQHIFFDVAVHIFRCCTTYFYDVVVFISRYCTTLFSICLQCCTWSVSCSFETETWWGTGCVGERGTRELWGEDSGFRSICRWRACLGRGPAFERTRAPDVRVLESPLL